MFALSDMGWVIVIWGSIVLAWYVFFYNLSKKGKKVVLLTLSARPGHRGSGDGRLEKNAFTFFELLLSDLFGLDCF